MQSPKTESVLSYLIRSFQTLPAGSLSRETPCPRSFCGSLLSHSSLHFTLLLGLPGLTWLEPQVFDSGFQTPRGQGFADTDRAEQMVAKV